MRDRLAKLAVWSSHSQLVCNSRNGMCHADFHFDIGLLIAMPVADGVGNWLVQSVVYEDIDYLCAKVVGPEGQI